MARKRPVGIRPASSAHHEKGRHWAVSIVASTSHAADWGADSVRSSTFRMPSMPISTAIGQASSRDRTGSTLPAMARLDGEVGRGGVIDERAAWCLPTRVTEVAAALVWCCAEGAINRWRC